MVSISGAGITPNIVARMIFVCCQEGEQRDLTLNAGKRERSLFIGQSAIAPSSPLFIFRCSISSLALTNKKDPRISSQGYGDASPLFWVIAIRA